MIRICKTNYYRADGSRFKHACNVGDEKAFCGALAAGWGSPIRSKEDVFVLGDSENCPKCERALEKAVSGVVGCTLSYLRELRQKIRREIVREMK